MLLALETAFNACSVCLYDGKNYILSHEIAPRKQTQRILPMIDDLLAKHQIAKHELSCIAFNRGPGSFSGIRINTAVAQALAFAHDTPCVPISSLQAQAQAVFDDKDFTEVTEVTVINDAKMSEVYLGSFLKNKDGVAQAKAEEKLIPVSHDFSDILLTEDFTKNVVGDGLAVIDISKVGVNTLSIDNDQQNLMTAKHIAKLAWQVFEQGGAVSAENAQPVYLRNNAWKTLAEQKASREAKQAN